MGRNVRTGYFDFYLAQPGNPLFMVSTRKLDPDGLANTFVAAAVIIYAATGLAPSGHHRGASLPRADRLRLVVHYSLFLLTASTTFWIIKTEGIEGSYLPSSTSRACPGGVRAWPASCSSTLCRRWS